MRIQCFVLLALAAVFAGDASATTTKAHSILVSQNDAPAQRLLRFDATADVGDDEEERAAWYEGVTKLFKTNTAPKVLTKLEREDPALAKLAKKYDLTGAFKSLGLTKVKSVDDLFTSEKYELWFSYMIHWNSQSKNKPFTVAKFFSKEFGAQKAFEMFATAAKSSKPNVQQMGKAYEVQLFKQFQKAGNTPQQISKTLGGDEAAAKMFATVIESSSKPDSKLGEAFRNMLLRQWARDGKNHAEVAKIAPSFAKAYTNVLHKMAAVSEGKAVALAKAKANAAAAAARV